MTLAQDKKARGVEILLTHALSRAKIHTEHPFLLSGSHLRANMQWKNHGHRLPQGLMTSKSLGPPFFSFTTLQFSAAHGAYWDYTYPAGHTK